MRTKDEVSRIIGLQEKVPLDVLSGTPDIWEVIRRDYGAGIERINSSGYAIEYTALETFEPNDVANEPGLVHESDTTKPYIEINLGGDVDSTAWSDSRITRLYSGQRLEVDGGFSYFAFRGTTLSGVSADRQVVLRIMRQPGIRVTSYERMVIDQLRLHPLNVAGPRGRWYRGAVTNPAANAVITGADTGQLFDAPGVFEIIFEGSVSVAESLIFAHRNAANSADVGNVLTVPLAAGIPFCYRLPAFTVENVNERFVCRADAAATAGLYAAAIYIRQVGQYNPPT